jgi:ribosomal protein S18 acetylase RimI-like enzyme
VKLTPLSSTQVETVLDLWERLMEAGETSDPRYRPTSDARSHMRPYVRRTWTRSKPFAQCLVAWDDSKAVGFVSCHPIERLPIIQHPPTAQIGDLWVSESHRRQGLGKRLVEDVTERAKKAGFINMEVGTLVLDARAVAFWRAMGFTDMRLTFTRRVA